MLSGNPTNANCDGSFQEDSFKKPRHYHIIISTINKDKKQCPKIWLRARKTFLSHFIKTYQAIKWMELHIPPLCVCVQFSLPVVSNSLRPHERQHAKLPCPSPTPGVHPNPCPFSRWCHPTILSSVIPFSSYLQSFPASASIFQWVSSLYQVARVLEFQLQHQSFQWIFRVDFLWDWLVGSPCSPRDSQESYPIPQRRFLG